MDFLTPILLVLGFAALGVLLLRRAPGQPPVEDAALRAERDALFAEKIRLEKDAESRLARAVELEKAAEAARTRVAELEEKGRGAFANFIEARAKLDAAETELRETRSRLTKYEAEAARREAELAEKLEKLHKMSEAAEAARHRLEREKIEAEERRIAERSRMWAEHEGAVGARFREICQRPEIGFQPFDNVNLPSGFDGSVKPDFFIEFLGQYVVFDAKTSVAADLAGYLTTNAKTTAKKLKNGPFYPTVFFVVPTLALADLPAGKTYFYEDGFSFFVIGPEALPAVLAMFRKIATYDQIEQLDPLERENIVKVFAALDQHINLRNAYDILAAEAGARALAGAAALSPEMRSSIAEQKKSIRLEGFAPTAIKKLLGSKEAQRSAVEELTSPKAAVTEITQLRIGE